MTRGLGFCGLVQKAAALSPLVRQARSTEEPGSPHGYACLDVCYKWQKVQSRVWHEFDNLTSHDNNCNVQRYCKWSCSSVDVLDVELFYALGDRPCSVDILFRHVPLSTTLELWRLTSYWVGQMSRTCIVCTGIWDLLYLRVIHV